MVVRHAEGANLDKVKAFAELMEDRHTGAENAYKTLHLYPGADVTVVGSNLKDVEFKAVRGAGETRIAAAAGCRPIIVGLSEGLASATYCGTFDDPVDPRGIVRLGDVRPGDAVWSFVDGHVEARKVTWQSQTGVKPVYTIRTKNRTIRFTDNHPCSCVCRGTRRAAIPSVPRGWSGGASINSGLVTEWCRRSVCPIRVDGVADRIACNR